MGRSPPTPSLSSSNPLPQPFHAGGRWVLTQVLIALPPCYSPAPFQVDHSMVSCLLPLSGSPP